MTDPDALRSLRKFVLLLIAGCLFAWWLAYYTADAIKLLSLCVAALAIFVTYEIYMTPSVRLEIGTLERGKLITPILLENLSKVAGKAKMLVELEADGRRLSAKEVDGETYYAWRGWWRFCGRDRIQGHFDVAKLLPGRALPDRHLAMRITTQWYTSFGFPVDAFTRYWTFDRERWMWILDVGGAQFSPRARNDGRHAEKTRMNQAASPASKVDKVLLRLLTILISGAGLFAVLTKYSVPEIEMSFWGQNPFMVKRSAIEGTMAWIFTGLAIIGVLVQVVSEIAGDKLAERLHKQRFYSKFFFTGLLVMVLIVCGLGRIGYFVAKRSWLPKVIENQRELFTLTTFMVEHGGWEPQEYEHLSTLDRKEERLKHNREKLDKNLAQMEKLFDVRGTANTPAQRLEALKRYFR